MASEPELTKNTWFISSGVSSETLSANSKLAGWPIPKGDV